MYWHPARCGCRAELVGQTLHQPGGFQAPALHPGSVSLCHLREGFQLGGDLTGKESDFEFTPTSLRLAFQILNPS